MRHPQPPSSANSLLMVVDLQEAAVLELTVTASSPQFIRRFPDSSNNSIVD
jgi:hypothetical protein